MICIYVFEYYGHLIAIFILVLLYMTYIQPAANKKHTENFYFCRYLYFIFTPYITNIMVQHEGCTLSIPTDFDFLTNNSSMKLSSFCKLKGMYIPLT